MMASLFPKFFLSNGSSHRCRKRTRRLFGGRDHKTDDTPCKRPDASSLSSIPSCSETTSSYVLVVSSENDLAMTSTFAARSGASQGRITDSPRRTITATQKVPLSEEMVALQNGDRRLVHQIRTERLLQLRDQHADVQNMLRGSRLPSCSSSISTSGSCSGSQWTLIAAAHNKDCA